MKIKVLKFLREKNEIFLILLSAFVFRLFISNFGTLELDHGTFIAWSNNLVSGGFKNFYSGWSDYFPGYLYFLYILGKINLLLPEYSVIIFKLPAIVADIITGFLIYKIVSKLKDSKHGLIFSSMYLFNPAIFANSSLWGQADSLVALFVVSSIYTFEKNILISAALLAIGTLVKPQAAFALPALLYLFLVSKKKILSYLLYAISGLTVFVLGFIPFNNKDNLYAFILERFNVSANQYPYGSVNAFSFWGLFGFWKPDDSLFWLGIVLTLVVIGIAFVFVYLKRLKAGEYLIAAVSLLATFIFMTRMHERHLLPTLAPLLIASSVNYLNLFVYVGLSLTYVANLAYAYIWISKEFKEIFNPLLIKIFISSNIALLFTAISSIFKSVKRLPSLLSYSKSKNELPTFSDKDISMSLSNKLLTLILLFAVTTRLFGLSNPKDMYFDEIYHAYTAKLVLHNDPKAWEWWNPHPEGFAYEWTHPPFSKIAMAFSMKIIGETQVGWRVPQAIAGTLAIFVVYHLAYLIFKDRKISLLSAFILSLDGLLLVLSRMGMNDSYVLLFTLLSVLFFIKDKNFWSSFFLGLAISSKWSSIYIIPIMLVAYFVFKKKFRPSYFFFVTIPLIVYVASYSLMFATGHTWSQFIEVQKQMWWYHTNLVAEHPYTSPAWSWPILLRPIYLFDGGVEDNMTSRIYASGNPFVFWFGLFSIIFSTLLSAKEKLSGGAGKRLGFVVFSYLVLFLPWIASPRIMFLYHYLPSVPYMVIASAFILRKYNKMIVPLLLLFSTAFVYFYPHWTAIKIPLSLDESYYWFSSWR